MPPFGQNNARQSGPEPTAVLEAFSQFVQGKNWSESFSTLERHQTELLSLPARLLIIQVTVGADDKEMRERLGMHLMLLEIAAQDGIAAARNFVNQVQDIDIASLSTMTTGGLPLGNNGAGNARPTQPPMNRGSEVDDMMANLSPEERRQVEAQLRQARSGDSAH